jgi:hypothetical protein
MHLFIDVSAALPEETVSVWTEYRLARQTLNNTDLAWRQRRIEPRRQARNGYYFP